MPAQNRQCRCVLTIQAELATMWKRSAEKAGAGDFAEAGAAALTWKVEAEKASRGLPLPPPHPPYLHSPLLPRTSNLNCWVIST